MYRMTLLTLFRGKQGIAFPAGSKILKVSRIKGAPTLHILVDPEEAIQDYHDTLVITAEDEVSADDVKEYTYVGCCNDDAGIPHYVFIKEFPNAS